MGSVQSQINCPICHSDDCIEDYYYKSGEEYIFCNTCGYYMETTLKKDKDNNLIKDKDGHFDYITIERKGKGIVRISADERHGISRVYTIPYDEHEKKKFLNKIWKFRKKNPSMFVEIKHYKEI